MLPALLVMGVGPILSWGNENKIETFKKIIPAIFLTVLTTVIIFSIYQIYSPVGILGISIAFWIIFNNLILFYRKKSNYLIGMIVAHLGIGFLILGVTGSSVWQTEKIVKMQINNETKINKYNIVLNKINEVKGTNYLALQGNFLVHDKNQNIITKLKPENRFYPVTGVFTSEASIHTNLFRDLYIVLGEGNVKEGWIVRIYHNPLVIWIWIGAFTIFLGGLLSINKNLRKLRR
jgi:cytochrome c-type biogenesis protein CcmF